MDQKTGVVAARGADGNVALLGLLACGKIWLCPVCSAKIRHGRTEEISKAVVAWIRQGGTAYLVTFTARHAANHQLADLMDAIQGTRADADKGIKRQPGAYQRLITGGTWAGRPNRGVTGIRDRVGYIGMIRATEVTLGLGAGWHPHIHAIVLVGGRTEGERGEKRIVGTFEPSVSALAELQDHWRAVWTNHLAKVDPTFTPSDERGVDFRKLETVRDAETIGEYIAKIQDGKTSISPAQELARGDMKSAKGGNMTPFELLHRIGDLMGGILEEDADGEGDQEWCLERWGEYERATKGRRAIEWTRYLRPLLGIQGGDDEEDDIDMLFDLDGASEFREGIRIDEGGWRRLARRALDLAATEAVEDGRLDEVAGLVVAAGGHSGAVTVLSSGEVAEAWQSMLAALAGRREAAAARRK